MKKICLFFLLIPFFNLFAQDNQNEKDYKWKITLQVNTPERISTRHAQTAYNELWIHDELYRSDYGNPITKDKSFAVSLIGNYYFKENLFGRGWVGINKVNIKLLPYDYVDTIAHYYYSAFKNENDFNVSIGLGSKLDFKQLSFYAGIEIPFTYYGKAQFYSYYRLKYLAPPPSDASNEITGTISNSYSIGIGNFGGFAFMKKHFSIGGEISYAFLYYKPLLETTFNAVTIDLTTNTVVNSGYTSTTSKVSIFDMSKVKGSINFSYNF